MKPLWLIMLIGTCLQCFSQNISESEKRQLLKDIQSIIEEKYVLEDKIPTLTELLDFDNYKQLNDRKEILRSINGNLASVDWHLVVAYDPDKIARLDISNQNPALFQGKERNFGFEKLEILEGNVGYIELTSFYHPEVASSTLKAAMNFMENTDALILDLRTNNGGSRLMAEALVGYFFKDKTHLLSIYSRDEPSLEIFTTPTQNFIDKPLFVLIDNRTFSAAEMVAYVLKSRNRAKIIGSSSRGGANTVGQLPIDDKYMINMSIGYVIEPVSKGNWERNGVIPDIETSHTLEVAWSESLKSLMKNTQDSTKLMNLKWQNEILESRLTPIEIPREVLQSYVGNYGKRTLFLKDKELYYRANPSAPEAKLIPITKSYFRFEEVDYFRIQVETSGGRVNGIKGVFHKGKEDWSPKND